MTDFESLEKALEGEFEKSLCDLQAELRKRIEMDFFPMSWNDLNPEQRRSVAHQWDNQHDPAMEQEREFWWKFFEGMDAIKQKIADWEATTILTADELEKKEKRLDKLNKKLAHMEKQLRRQDKQSAGGLVTGSPEWRSQVARNAANALHNKAGGSRDKQQQMRDIWATGKYTSRDRCAEEECAALDISFSTARKALRNTPEPPTST